MSIELQECVIKKPKMKVNFKHKYYVIMIYSPGLNMPVAEAVTKAKAPKNKDRLRV